MSKDSTDCSNTDDTSYLDNLGFNTLAIHYGQEEDPNNRRANHAHLPDINICSGRTRQKQRLQVRSHT